MTVGRGRRLNSVFTFVYVVVIVMVIVECFYLCVCVWSVCWCWWEKVEGGRLIPLSVQHCIECVCVCVRERGSLVFTYLRYLECIYI